MDLRLAYGGPPEALAHALGMTDLRLVGANVVDAQTYQRRAFGDLAMTDLRLVGASAGREDSMAMSLAPTHLDPPALLVSYAYWEQFARHRATYHFRDYSLDSGAFSVKHSGGVIDLDEYIAFCQERLTTDPQCTEVFALDVIGDWRGSSRNAERMWAAGVPAIPVYHYGEPPGVLKDYCAAHPKVGLGGLVKLKPSVMRQWCEQVFATVWPHRLHGLGIMGEGLLMALPFHSVDSSTWQSFPTKWGNWRRFGKIKGVRGGSVNLRAEVEHYLAMERRVKQRWAATLAGLEASARPWPVNLDGSRR